MTFGISVMFHLKISIRCGALNIDDMVWLGLLLTLTLLTITS